jgi:hypothetical protein
MIKKNSQMNTKLVTLIVASLFLNLSFAQSNKPSIKDLTKKESPRVENREEESSSSSVASEVPSGVNKHSIGLGIGQTFLFSDFQKNGENGITGELIYSYSASHSFDFVVDLHLSSHEYQDKETKLFGVVPGIKSKLYQFDSFSPYVIGGLGFYRPQLKRYIGNSLVLSEAKTVLGYSFGAGGDLRLNNHYAVGILFQYHNPFDVKQDSGEEVEGSYGKLLLTLSYTF